MLNGLPGALRLLSKRAMRMQLGSPDDPEMVRLHVETYEPAQGAESSPTVVLCHGFGGSARNFRPQARALGQSVRFVLYDARGHARSDGPRAQSIERAFSLGSLVDDLARVVDGAQTSTVVLGGLSMGAATALAFALAYPERVSGLLIASYPNASVAFRNWALGFAACIAERGLDSAGEMYVWGQDSRFDVAAKALIRQGFLEHSEAALIGLLRDCLANLEPVELMSERLEALRIPTRVVVGAEDAGSFEPSKLLSRLIPGAKLSVLAGAGHVVNLERASAFNEELRQLIFQP